MSSEEYRAASQEQWGGSASEWARAAEEVESGASAAATEWMLEAADLQPGERVLELACGAGRVGLQATPRVGAEGLVVCSDFAEPMVEAVREGAKRLGLENVEARVLDAENLGLEAGESFDVVLCRFGYMLMSDPLQALRESAGALAPDGRLVLAVWGPGPENPWLATILETVMAHFGAPPPPPGTPGPFALGNPARVESLLGEAGFADASAVTLEAEQSYESAAAWWEEIRAVSGPLAALLDSLSKEDLEAVQQRALAAAEEYVGRDGAVVFPAAIVGARAARAAA